MLRASAAALIAAAALSSPLQAQCPDGTPPPCHSARAVSAAAPAASIAVLYFDNLSRDSGDVYLADGFTEEVMNRLGQVEGLQVKSRTAVQSARSRGTGDPLAAGRSLNVAHLVSGSVLRQRGRVRVNVELTRVSSGNRVWGGSFDRGAEDLIGTEAEIAESIAVNVGARLAPAERSRIEAQPTRNAAAYDHLLRARYERSRSTTAGYLAAVRQYEAALRLDSNLTSARVGLSTAYTLLGSLYWSPDAGLSRESLQVWGRRQLEQALRQDSTSYEALMARSTGVGPQENIALLQRAIALAPRAPEAHHNFGLSLRQLGRDSEAVEEFKRALQIEPDRAISLVNIGQTYIIQRRYAEAARWVDSAVALRPEAAFYYKELALFRLLRGDTAGARAAALQIGSHGSTSGREEILGMIEARAGDSAAARARLAPVDAAMANDACYVSHDCLELVMALAAVGSRERALSVFERVTPREAWIAYWSRRPEFDAIRNEPRFQGVVAEARANAAARR